MFRRNEKKRAMPWVVITVGGLAAVGAASIFCRGRGWLRAGKRKIESIFSSCHCESECGCD